MSYIKYIKYLPILLLILSSGWLYWQNARLESKIENTVQQVEYLEETNNRLSSTVDTMRRMSLEQAESLEQLFSNDRLLQSENNSIQRDIERYRNREEVILQRPSLVERRINDASDDLMQQYSCTTGGECRDSGAEGGEGR